MRAFSSLSRRSPITNPFKHLPAQHLLDEMPHRDSARLNALLSAHVRNNNPTSALLLFLHMHRHNIPLDGFTFNPVLFACSALPAAASALGRQLHSLMFKLDYSSEPIPATSLLNMYSKCGFFSDAVNVFDEMPKRDVVSWNALLSCFIHHGHSQRTINAFFSMVQNGIEFTGFTLSTVLKACASSRSLLLGLQLHALVFISGYHNSLVIATSLIDFYSSCGMVTQAMQVFTLLNSPKDTAMRNALITGLVQSQRYDDAFALFAQTTPNAVAFTLVLTACFDSLNLEHGKQIHCAALRRDFTTDTVLCNVLVRIYAKCGDIHSAHSTFSMIDNIDVVSWTGIIDACGSQGCGLEALNLFKEMESVGSVLPNAVTFISVLSACGHSGLIDKGLKYFNVMKNKYGIDPGAEHYACVIDMLGKGGRIEEAWEVYGGVVKEGKLSSGVCVAMLNGCKVCMDLGRGEVVAKHMMELGEEDKAGVYVLLSNFYAGIGRWKGAEEVRKVMEDRGLRKEVGTSLIAIGC
ncbi:putative tetratricopeptide-like helical domain superfamily [Dioscorea sansibarensis]